MTTIELGTDWSYQILGFFQILLGEWLPLLFIFCIQNNNIESEEDDINSEFDTRNSETAQSKNLEQTETLLGSETRGASDKLVWVD